MRLPKVLKSVRYSLIAVNGLFLITGIILLIVGIVVLIAYNNYNTLVTNTFHAIPRFLIATAVIIFFTAILGFYGAVSEEFYFIVGYVALLITILIFEASITVMGFKLQDNAFNELRTPMIRTLQEYVNRREVAIVWDDLQMGFECCGIAGQGDWTINRLPVSCCIIPVGTISPFDCTNLNANRVGCQSLLSEWLGNYAYVAGVTAAFVTSLQILITAAAGWLAYRSKFEEVELEQ